MVPDNEKKFEILIQTAKIFHTLKMYQALQKINYFTIKCTKEITVFFFHKNFYHCNDPLMKKIKILKTLS